MRVGIIGAGITGLALTHFLTERGIESITFEASDEPGGAIQSRRIDGHVVEVGPQRLRRTPTVGGLIDDLSLEDDVIEADDNLPLFVYADGALGEVPRSIGTFLRTDLLSWRGKLRVLTEPLTAPGRPDETAEELFTRKFGREAYEKIVGPLFGGMYGSDPAAMPAEHALSGLLRLEQRRGSLLKVALRRLRGDGDHAPAISFDAGLQQFPEALYAAHRDRIALSTRVDAIRDRERGGGYAVETADGIERVDHVVVTTPAFDAADMLHPVAPSATALRRLNYNPLALVYLHADLDRDGLGYQVRRTDPIETLGVSWNASMFGRDGVYTCFLGGMTRPELVGESDDALERIATTEFEHVTGTPATAIAVARLRHAIPAYDTSWMALDELDLPDDIELATNYTARMGIPGRVREAKGIADRLTETTDSESVVTPDTP